jgi:hypothetical protein
MNFFKKVKFDTYLHCLEIVILIGGLSVAYLELHNIQMTNSGNLTLEIYKDIKSDQVFKNNPKIIEDIANGTPILKENGGKLDEIDLNNYLGLFDWISAANKTGVISNDMVYDFYGDYILDTYNNKEIRGYISTLRKGNNNGYYQGIIDLVAKINLLDKKWSK